MTRVKRVKSLRVAAVLLAVVIAASACASATPAGPGKAPGTVPSPEVSKAATPPHNQFLYTLQAQVGIPTSRIEMWASVDGSRLGAVRWAKCPWEGREILQCMIRILPGKAPYSLDDRTYGGVQRELPADPAGLAAYLKQHNACNADPEHPKLTPDEGAFSEIISIVDAVQVLPPHYGALLFQAAAKLPGTKVLAHVTDAAGGSGTAVSMVSRTVGVPKEISRGRNWGRTELIFTPGTYRYVGLQEFLGTSARGPWTLGRATTLRSYKFVKTAPSSFTGGAYVDWTLCVAP
jgi:hypothetical protein